MGMAIMEWPNGCKYEGHFQQNKKHGEGTFWWADGRSYRGQWFEGKAHGQGVSVSADGQEVPRTWEHGEQVSATPQVAVVPQADAIHQAVVKPGAAPQAR